MRRAFVVVILATVLLVAGLAQAKGSGGSNKGGGSSGDSSSTGSFAIGLNVMQPLVFLMASQFSDEEETTYILPIPVEIHAHIQKHWGLCGTVQITMYRIGDGETHSMGEIMAAGGPRYRITGKKLAGLYVTGKVGLSYWGGTAHGVEDYRRLNLIIQPEVGYSLTIGTSGFFMAFGVGLQAGLRLAEKNGPVDWNGTGKMLLGYTPWLNVTIGFGG